MKHLIMTTLAGMTLAASAWPASASIIINEIDYDQPGADTAEFIELYNAGAGTALDGYRIDLINGGNSSVYLSIDLAGFSLDNAGYFVVCDNPTLVANCDYAFTSGSGWLQNGAPDAIALLNDSTIIDSLSYEGELAPYTEGTVLSVADSNSLILSIARIPDAQDTNNNDFDYQLGCITPGSANISGSGDCSALSTSPVPLPPAVWLFGAGLLGLLKVAQRKHN